MQLQTIICTCAHGWYFDFSHQQASVVSSSCQVDLVWLSHNVEQCSQRCWCDSYKGSTSWWPRQPCRQCSSPSCPKHAEEETYCQGDTTGQGEEHKAVAKAAGSPKKPGLKAKFFFRRQSKVKMKKPTAAAAATHKSKKIETQETSKVRKGKGAQQGSKFHGQESTAGRSWGEGRRRKRDSVSGGSRERKFLAMVASKQLPRYALSEWNRTWESSRLTIINAANKERHLLGQQGRM